MGPAELLSPLDPHGAHARGETPARVITGGEGIYITDREGNRSLDAFAGLYCVNVGYGRKRDRRGHRRAGP